MILLHRDFCFVIQKYENFDCLVYSLLNMNKSDFLCLNINPRADMVWDEGEFIGSQSYYGYNINNITFATQFL